jgi:hypothetical protein
MPSSGIGNRSGTIGCAIESANGMHGGVTNASSGTGTIIDSGVIRFTVAGNGIMAELFGG